MASDVQIVMRHDHYELYINGEFYCSADNITEAADEADKYLREAEE